MNKGFKRLKGVAAASAMGLGLLGGAGSVRAATVSTRRSGITVQRNGVTFGVQWNRFRNTSISGGVGLRFSGTSVFATPGSNFTTTLGASGFAVSSQTGFGLIDAKLVTSTSSGSFSGPDGAFDTALWLAVNQTMFINPGTTVDLTGDVLTTNTAVNIVSGIDANIRYYFAPDRNVVRALYTLTNTTATDVTAELRVGGNLGSGSRTNIQATSDGDLVIEDTDYWHVTNDSPSVGDDGNAPDITLTRCGVGAPVCPLNGVSLGQTEANVDDFIYFYAVTVPANSSIRVMNFAELGRLSNGLVARAADFETLAAADTEGLLDGLSAVELSELVNYGADTDFDTVLDSADNCPNDANTTQTNTDGDAAGDVCDAFPTDPTETVDTDSDGVGDNADAFPNDSTETVDTDGDTVGDNADNCPVDANITQADADSDNVGDTCDAFPNDATETVDTDSDGVGDNADAFPNDAAETADTDGDGVGDNADAFPNDATETVDTDGDGVGDNADVFPNDATETVDTDSDGVGDNADAFPNDATETVDTDSDGVGDNADAFPNDATETVDTDGDGVGDNADAFPNDASKTTASSGGGSSSFLGLGSFSLPGLAVILGLLPILRTRRKTKK